MPALERRLTEAAKLGFTKLVVPAGSGLGKGEGAPRVRGAAIVECRTVQEAFKAVLGSGGGGGGGGAQGRRRGGGWVGGSADDGGDEE